MAPDRAREFVIARTQFLSQLNGATFTENERRDCELFYLKQSYKEYLESNKLVSVTSISDPALCAYMQEQHPRWF